MSRYGEPELTTTPCPICGRLEIFVAEAPPGMREMPLYLRCCGCGRERDELMFHEEQCRAAA
jgi:hypothetical protein